MTRLEGVSPGLIFVTGYFAGSQPGGSLRVVAGVKCLSLLPFGEGYHRLVECRVKRFLPICFWFLPLTFIVWASSDGP